MDNEDGGRLILQRYQIIKHITSTKNKTIKVVRDRVTGQKLILKTYAARSMLILTQAAFMQFFQGHAGVPFVTWVGSKETQTVLLTQYLGDTLQQKFKQCSCRFSLKTVCMVGLEILQIIHSYHEKGILYRNIDLKTFQYGRGYKQKKLYLNDLSLSKRYRNKKTFEHIENMTNIQYDDLNLFSTQSAYKGSELSRRDQLQSVILMLIYMLKGLQWQHHYKNKPHKMPSFQDINELQEYSNVNKLCEGIPNVFRELIINCRKLNFTQEPNYYWYIQKIKALMFHRKIQNDKIYDWVKLPTHVEKLKVCKNIPRIKIDSDIPILQEIYDPVAQVIELDDLQEKYKQFLERKKAGRVQVLGEIQYQDQDILRSKNGKGKDKKKQECLLM